MAAPLRRLADVWRTALDPREQVDNIRRDVSEPAKGHPCAGSTAAIRPADAVDDGERFPVADSPRSLAVPTIAVSGNGTVFAAWQERVNISTCVDPGCHVRAPQANGSPRIVLVRSSTRGDTWTAADGVAVAQRRAIDFGDRDVPGRSDHAGARLRGFAARSRLRAADPAEADVRSGFVAAFVLRIAGSPDWQRHL